LLVGRRAVALAQRLARDFSAFADVLSLQINEYERAGGSVVEPGQEVVEVVVVQDPLRSSESQ
jgi:hypothetical protein